MISVSDAQEIVLESVEKMDSVKRSISDALDHFVSDAVTAPCDVPPFDNSAMDGFALKSEETGRAGRTTPLKLRVVGTVRAGDSHAPVFKKGECLRIMTGAVMPRAADAVVKIEDISLEDGIILLTKPVPSGANVRLAGEDIKKSEPLLSPGTRLRPQEIGVLASLGIARIAVTRKPRVSVLTTGDELVGIEEALTPGKIRDSNRYSLSGLLRRLGCQSVECGIVADEADAMKEIFREALATTDAILSTGGVSMGQYDLVRETISSLGEVKFWKVNMKPGKPLLFATADGKPMFGLPGNPVSCMVSFELFARPALLKMMGSRNLFREELLAEINSPVTKQKGRSEFHRGKMWREGDTLHVAPTGPQGSGILTSMVRGNCLIHLPEEKEDVSEGELVRVLPI